MKKLLFISPSFPKDDSESYITPFLQHVFLAFTEKHPEIELTIITIHKPQVKKVYYWNGIKVIPLGANNVKYPWKIIFLLKAFYKVNRLIKINKYDGILNFWYNEFVIFLKFYEGKKYVWLQGQDVKKENPYLHLFKPDPKEIIAISNYNNEILNQSIGNRAHKIIPIAVNEKLFPNFNREERNIDVFGAGHLSELKNYQLFIEAILELKKVHPNIKVELAGTGEKVTELKNFAKKNHLENNIVFLGQLTHKETLEKMNQSKIFLHPSTFEGGSTVYFEALYSGCMLVGTLEIVGEPIENFYHCTNKSEIVETIKNLLFENKTSKRVLHYSMDQVCEEIYKLFFN